MKPKEISILCTFKMLITCRNLYLGLELIMHVLKRQIYLKRQSFKDKTAYFLICKQVHMRWNDLLYSNQICGLNLKFQSSSLKGPKHDQVGCEFFYIQQTRMVRWLGDWRKKLFLFLFGEDNRQFVFLANAEHRLKIIKRTISVSWTFFSVCSA